ncbi:putative Heterokaryon incompatibility domain-containing protein [Seiridium cardinale]|uniref:Heterokaryon incompatibility domain-containing protein n=1 Tax=Seiridium cardinale TaxID=138064 RepID=A0ABR2Y7D9_9PEZI
MSQLLQATIEEELPATIRDVIELTRHLGVRYLWVDALCIVQDDTQDWIHESAQMATVYAHAFLTISASSVANSRHSFLHQSRSNGEVLLQLPKSATSDRRHDGNVDGVSTGFDMLAMQKTPTSGIHQAPHRLMVDPVMCHACAPQEYALSTPVVSFSRDELQWTCRMLRACECGNPEGLDYPRIENLRKRLKAIQGEHKVRLENDTKSGGIRSKFACLEFWYNIVETYCRRELSWARDKCRSSRVLHMNTLGL